MLTNNFKSVMAVLLETTSGSYLNGLLPCTDIVGDTRYISPKMASAFPYSVGQSVVFSTSLEGIIVGTGDTPATPNDTRLEAMITSGLTASSPAIDYGIDADGDPYIQFTFTLSNTTASDITIKEIGYVQKANTSVSQGVLDGYNSKLLFDRTILSTPVTIPANDTGAIRYTLKTIIS